MKRNILLFSLLTLLTLILLGGCSSEQPATSVASSPSPLEKALASGKPTLAEFGRGTCIPCKEMKPILDELAVLYKDKLNVVIVSVDDYRDLTISYGIMAIPTQIFFDSRAARIAVHIGFYPKEEILTQLTKMGIE